MAANSTPVNQPFDFKSLLGVERPHDGRRHYCCGGYDAGSIAIVFN